MFALLVFMTYTFHRYPVLHGTIYETHEPCEENMEGNT